MSEYRRAAARERVADRAHIIVTPGVSLDVALKRFRRSVDRSGVLRELKRRESHIKPGEARRSKSRRARKRAASAAAKGAGAFTPTAEWNEKPWAGTA